MEGGGREREREVVSQFSCSIVTQFQETSPPPPPPPPPHKQTSQTVQSSDSPLQVGELARWCPDWRPGQVVGRSYNIYRFHDSFRHKTYIHGCNLIKVVKHQLHDKNMWLYLPSHQTRISSAVIGVERPGGPNALSNSKSWHGTTPSNPRYSNQPSHSWVWWVV